MKIIIRCLAAVLVLGLVVSPAAAASFSSKAAGTSGAQFLKIGPGARAVGMGEAFTSIADDATAMYWNPAGMGLLKRPVMDGMHLEWFQDIRYDYVALAVPFKKAGAFGVSFTNLAMSGIQRRTVAEEDTATELFGAQDFAYGLGYSYAFRRIFSVGLGFKYIHQTIDTYKSNSFAADLGFIVKPLAIVRIDLAEAERARFEDYLSIGLVVVNMGSKVKFISAQDPLPLTIKIGASSKPIKYVTVSADAALPKDNKFYVCLGAEGSGEIVKDLTLAARAGWRSGFKMDGTKGVSVGGGITYKHIGFDFAFVPYGDLGGTYRYSLRIRF